MLMTQSAQPQQQQPTNFAQQVNNNISNANAQLANLLPILNLPIFTQLLNGMKGATDPQAQQHQQLNNPLNLNSTAASTLSRLLKATSTNNDNGMSFDPSNLLNQPLNLCKEMSQGSGSVGQQHTQQQYHGNNHRKSSTQNKSSPPPLSFTSADRNPYLSVNVNGSNHANSLANNISSNNIPNSIFNTSPSPSISSSSCSTSSSTEKTVNSQTHHLAQHLNHIGSKLHSASSSAFSATNNSNNNHLSAPNSNHKSASYIINNRRQRERTTFDPQEEITRLMSIFERTHHPTRYQIASICDSLNSLACRRDKKPLEPYNIQYWFKNARAALRRKVKVEGDSTPSSGARSASSSAIKTEFDSIFNGQQDAEHEAYVNSKYSNYDDEENELDEDYDDEYGNQHNENDTTGYSLDPKLDSNVDLNNNHNDGMKLGNNHQQHKSVHKSQYNNQEEEREHVGDEEHSHLDHYENYNEENTLDDEEDNNYLNSTYDHGNNHLNECNESFDEDNYKINSLNSTKTSNMLGNAQKTPNKNSMSHNNSSMGNSHNGAVCNRRNRVFIDPISEVPILEHYFSIETYPDHYLIEKICENLNKGEYRFKFPKLESRNIQLWFKNHRAKLKRLKSTPNSSAMNSNNNNISSNLNNSDDQMQAVSEMKAEIESEPNFNMA